MRGCDYRLNSAGCVVVQEQLCTAQSNQEFAELELRATKDDLDNKEQQLVRSQQAQEDVENILTDYR